MSDQEREALGALVKWIDYDLDLSDEFSVEQAVRRELISCTRPKECWERGDVVIKAARAALAAREEPRAQTHEYEMPESVIVELAKREVIAEIVKRPFLLAIFNGPSPELDALAEGIARAVLAVTAAARGDTERPDGRFAVGDKVRYQSEVGDQSYPGTVREVQRDGAVLIEWSGPPPQPFFYGPYRPDEIVRDTEQEHEG